MKTLFLSILSTFLASTLMATQEPENNDLYRSGSLGISIVPPISETETEGNYTVAHFFLPAKNGFSGNVNVQKQYYPGTIDSYNELSVKQFKELGITILKNSNRKDELMYESKGIVTGYDLHFYTRAIKKGDHVFLVTATGLAKDWESQKKKLMESVNSFKLAKE